MNEKTNNETVRPHAVINTRRVDLLFWRTCGLNAIGLIAAWILFRPEVEFENPISFLALVFAIWLLDWILKPVLVVCTLPFIVLTFGAGMIFINALVIWAAAGIVPGITFGSGWSGLFNSIVASLFVSILSWGVALAAAERVVRRSVEVKVSSSNNAEPQQKNGNTKGKQNGKDVIDI